MSGVQATVQPVADEVAGEPPPTATPWGFLVVIVVLGVLLGAGAVALVASQGEAPAVAGDPALHAEPGGLTTEELERRVAARPDDVEARLRLAHRWFDDARYDEAMEHYLAVLRIRREPEALSHAGWIAFEAGDAGTAERLLAEAVERAPTDPETLWFTANVRLASGDARGAVAALEALVDDDRLSPTLRHQARTLLLQARATVDEEAPRG